MVKKLDLAITMYKKNRMFDDVIRLVANYHPEFLKETHVHLAKVRCWICLAGKSGASITTTVAGAGERVPLLRG